MYENMRQSLKADVLAIGSASSRCQAQERLPNGGGRASNEAWLQDIKSRGVCGRSSVDVYAQILRITCGTDVFQVVL